MRPKYLYGLPILLTLFLILGCATGGTFSIHLKYQPDRDFPSLQQKLGARLGIAPFKDERSDSLYIGHHTSLRGISSYFKSDPFPLEKAIEECIRNMIFRHGVKTTPVSNWDGRPESLKTIEADSVLMIEIKQFWIEGKAAPFRTKAKASVSMTLHLGVKKEGKVFTRNIEVEKEATLARLTAERVEQMINQTLTEIFNSFFSNPYEIPST